MCTGRGIAWLAAAPARCSLGISSRLRTEQTLYGNSAHCRIRPTAPFPFPPSPPHRRIREGHIFQLAGCQSPQLQTEGEMIKAIREAGRIPVQGNTFYEPIKVSESGSGSEPQRSTDESPVLKQNLATA